MSELCLKCCMPEEKCICETKRILKENPLDMTTYQELLNIDLDEYYEKLGDALTEISQVLIKRDPKIILKQIERFDENELKFLCANYFVGLILENVD